jgi:hypothetical protein
MYFSIGVGSLLSTIVMKKIGDIKCMSIGSLFNIPWILSLALCGWRGDYDGDYKPFYLRSYFIAPLILVLSILNGLGQGI